MQNYSAKIKNFKFLIVILIFAFFIFNFSYVSAYHLLEPLPSTEGLIKEATLSDYLSWLFRFALAAAAFLAVLQITIGGIQMIFGGASETARTNAKQRIQDAIWGLVLALGSVLILTTISPQFTDIKLTIPDIKVTVEKATTGTKGKIVCVVNFGFGVKHDSTAFEYNESNKQAMKDACYKSCLAMPGISTTTCEDRKIQEKYIECFITFKDKEGKTIETSQGSFPYELNREAAMKDCKKACEIREGLLSAQCREKQ